MSLVSVVLPTFNERQNVVALIECLIRDLDAASLDREILVMDDDSPDGTADAVRQRFGDRNDVRVTVRTANHGLAESIYDGIQLAQGDTVVVMDSDFNHDSRLVPLFARLLEDFDVIIGSRYVLGGGMDERWRYWASFAYNFLLRLSLQTQVQDNLSGFFAIHRSALLELATPQVFTGYGEYFMRLLFAAQSAGLTMLEVPSYYWIRPHGATKSRFWKMFLSYTRTALHLWWTQPRLPGRGTRPYVPPGAAGGLRPMVEDADAAKGN